MASESTAAERNEMTGASPNLESRRLVVVDAFIDLVLESGSPPTPEEVADRAGVSRATFFRYFSTLVELRNEAAARVVGRFADLFTIPEIGTGTFDERVRRYVHARLQLHEVLHPLELLTRSHAVHDADTAKFVDAVRRLHADQTRQHFEADLHPHGPARRDDMVTAIAVLTSVESWEQFRHTFGRSLVQTNRAWRAALTGIIADASALTNDNGGGHHAR